MILALSGGTGGSKMVDGLAQVVGQPALTAVVNTGDDGDFYGLRVCPDLDICTYVLAGVVSERGWGYAEDTFRCLDGLATYGRGRPGSASATATWPPTSTAPCAWPRGRRSAR